MADRTTLYQYPLCPYCRTVRLALFEKGVSYSMVFIAPNSQNPSFLRINPTGALPTLVEVDGYVLSDSQAILEYLNELKPYPDLLGETPRGRAEVRRLIGWFDKAFYQEVYRPLFLEKVMKLLKREEPDAKLLRAGRMNLNRHLAYVDWLAGRKNYLAGRYMSYADLVAAAHVSTLDYLGEISWESYPEAAAWYAKIKSRPSFESVLKDRLTGIPPADGYASLDFLGGV